MDFELPTEYDEIILGTGMTECIVAAALSRIGHNVLHTDRNDYYSGDWASFHLQAMNQWIESQTTRKKSVEVKDVEVSSLLKDGETTCQLTIDSSTISNLKQTWTIGDKVKSTEDDKDIPDSNKEQVDEQTVTTTDDQSTVTNDLDPEMTSQDDTTTSDSVKEDESTEKDKSDETDGEKIADKVEEEESVKTWYRNDVEKEWRKFNLDLMPKILFCRGPMVELLISSDIAKYCEFRALTRILTLMDGKICKVPCSRADVFSSKEVSMIEKRMLMKLLSFCLEYDQHPDQYQDFSGRPFVEFLRSKKLTPTVSHYIQHGIARVNDTTTTEQGLKNTKQFLRSLGRYGNTAFLWPLYGAGELPQAFCRMSAVFGGVYCLQRTARCYIQREGRVCGVIDTQGQRLNAPSLIMNSSYAPQSQQPSTSGFSRAILITDQSILPEESEQISLLSLPSQSINDITLMELSAHSLACPSGLHVVHLSCVQCQDAGSDLLPTIQSLFNTSTEDSVSEKPRVLWSLFFNMADTSQHTQTDLPAGVHIVSGPNNDLDFDSAIEAAQKIFNEICPGEEFLPRAPNPEDIIIESEKSGDDNAGGFSSEKAESEDGGATEMGDGQTGDGDGQTVDGDGQTGDGDGQTVDGDGQTGDGNGQTVDGDGQTGDGNGQTGDGDRQTGDGDGQTGDGDGQTGDGDGQTGDGDGQTGDGDGQTVDGEKTVSSEAGVTKEWV